VDFSRNKVKIWTYREGLPGETVEEILEDIEIVKREDGYYVYSCGNLVGVMLIGGYYFWA